VARNLRAFPQSRLRRPQELNEIYDKYDYLDEKREALAEWEDYLSKLLAG